MQVETKLDDGVIHSPEFQQSLSPLNEASLAGTLESLFPTTLRRARNDSDNAIEYRNIMLLGSQGSGKTTLAQSIALMLGRRYGIANTTFALQVAGIDRLLEVPTRLR